MAPPDPFVELLDEGRAEASVAARGRERALGRMAEEGARLAGALVDLAERMSPVAVRTEAGRSHHGVLVEVGTDYCRLRADTGAESLLRLSAIASVRPHRGTRQPAATSDRSPSGDQRLLEVLGRAAGDRPRVVLVVRGGDVLAGRLRSVGIDVVTLHLDGEEGQGCYVPEGAITEAWLEP
ncbi:MAG: hypothetical protein M3N15_05950 [Actinomycetota bacterium]|nr:hypothetical protein [Actinomycetota bacterium]